MSHSELTVFILAVALLLALARTLGEAARAIKQPAVVGEILAGVILGPTVFGLLAPGLQSAIFPAAGNGAIALQAISSLSIIMFLLVAGMEVDLKVALSHGRASLVISFFGMLVPFATGFACASLWPVAFGAEPGTDMAAFAMFLGTALSISALPVIAKTLMDLNMYRSDFGMIIISAAVIGDITGWILFAVIIGMIGANGAEAFSAHATVALTSVFCVFLLTAGRKLLNKALPFVQAYTSWPGGALGFAMAGALLCAAFTNWIGVHAIFGAFIFGVALGESRHLQERTRRTLEGFISFIFAPLFFASVGLKVDFAHHFDLPLTVLVIIISTVGKLAGCGVSARLTGFSWRESMAIGVGLNARGAMEIVLALLALQFGLIGERLFVALVVMALFTSIIAGGLISRILRRAAPARLIDFINAGAFIAELESEEPREAIVELAAVAAKAAGLPAGEIAAAVWRREQMMSTGLGKGVAAPHARIVGLKTPVVAVGLSRNGVEFDSPDGEPAQVVFLTLTPADKMTTQVELLSDIAGNFIKNSIRQRAIQSKNFAEFLSALKTGGG
jgi:Kef-type K+ transport system membrane component KefB/mannitol/fructose-specific phosphotransferase system IIA component